MKRFLTIRPQGGCIITDAHQPKDAKMPKIKCQTSLKDQALTRLLQDRESISSICEDLKISPVVLGQWSREVIGGLPLVFDKSLKKAERGKERKNDELRQAARLHLQQHVAILPAVEREAGEVPRLAEERTAGRKGADELRIRGEGDRPAIDYYNNLRLHSAIGYVTPRDMMVGRAPEIQAKRERKLKEAREQRKLANRRRRVTLTAHRETEDGSAGEQPSRDGDVV